MVYSFDFLLKHAGLLYLVVEMITIQSLEIDNRSNSQYVTDQPAVSTKLLQQCWLYV